jgi:signal transduction histidine kinase
VGAGILLVAGTGAGASIWLLPAAAVCLAAAWRRARRAPAVLVAVALLLAVAAQLHLRLEARRWRSHSEQRVGAALEGLELRARRLYSILQDLSLKAAALPDAPAALSGDTAALGRLFRELERLRAPLRERPAVGIDTPQMTTVAWSGRLGNTVALRGLLADRPDIYLLEGNVTTTLVGHAPIRGPAGQPLGHAIASLPLAVRRNISNDFLRDFDVLAAGDPGVELRYLDARSDDGQPRAAFPPLDPALAAREGVLRTPRGSALAVVRVTAPALPAVQSQLLARYRRLIALVLLAAIAVALWQRRPPSAGVVLLAATGGRGLLLALGVPAPAPGSTVLSPEIYASPLLGPLLRSPLDLFLTAAWLLVAVVALWRLTAPALGRHASWRWAPAAVVLAAAALAAVFHLVSDTLANTALEIDAIPLLPQSPAHLLIQVSLLFMLASALIVVTLGLTTLPRLSRAPSSLALHLLVGPALVVLLTLPRPASWPPPPLVPAAILVLAGALLAGWRDGWELRLRSASPGTRAALVLLAVAGLALVLYPSLNHYASVATRARIETDYAPLVERQPQWREYMLAETRRRVDSLRLLGDAAPPGAQMPGVEELAFAVWSATDLAAFGLSSAVEIQDARGAVISRFALNLPSLAGPPQDVPPNDGWRVSPERLTLASAEQGVLHARRRLSYDGQTHGGVHVFVADDYWNLPFLRGRDPYSILFRTASPPAARERPVALVVYGEHRDVVFSSVDHPPLLEPSLAARLTTGMGQWTRLPVDGQPHHAYVFRSGDQIHVLAYPELTAARYVADMVEAAAGVSLVGVLVFLALVSVRTLLGRRSLSLGTMVRTVKSRFALRVFVAFIVLAALPVVVLQVVVRDFLLDRLDREFQEQALERAAVAKKAVEDFAFFQRGEAASGQPVTDAAMVWLSSVVRNDLDVFERGRLLASSKRELYASGLLAPRVSGAVFRDLVLEGRSSVLRRERIGDFTYLVASVPVRLEKGEPGILAIPLALRQREVQATVADLDRTIRLAAVGFLALAAALAQSLARRISGPISELTRATRRIAQGDLDARVTARSQDELQRLVESFNQMAGDLDRQRRDLERSNRLAAWAEMARQVAHEVKNPLTPIQLSAEHLRRVYHDPDVDFARALESCTQTILKQVGNLRGMVTEFSSFARPPATELEPVDPGALVADVVRPYAEALPPGVHLSVEAPSGLPPVRGDRRLLHRAVVNLVENALQAVGERGEVAVLARTLDGRVEIDVRDSGPGIAPELREKVFEPFFSTKTTGSGLGLALVRKIAEDHGGGVSLDSAAGRGTRALLWLPASARDNDT